jgi:hypothetical protein
MVSSTIVKNVPFRIEHMGWWLEGSHWRPESLAVPDSVFSELMRVFGASEESLRRQYATYVVFIEGRDERHPGGANLD